MILAARGPLGRPLGGFLGRLGGLLGRLGAIFGFLERSGSVSRPSWAVLGAPPGSSWPVLGASLARKSQAGRFPGDQGNVGKPR